MDNKMKKIAVLLAALMFAACATPKTSPTQSSANSGTSTATTVATASAVNPASNVSSSTQKASEEAANSTTGNNKVQPNADAAANAKLAGEIQSVHNESVYFDYDEYALKPEFRNNIENQATNFKNRPNASLTLEGNADERGSAAYNIALGEKRANAVKKVLVILGLPTTKIRVVSYGNTKPKLDCHEEKCWKENRRVDFVFKE
jgi:peptidoglycan-associated lipoprotein